MIILKHLTVERFRLLRELNVHFPQRGSILIQGPNESGKSALLESIYFALYGEPLAYDRERRSLDDLISYGARSATVALICSVGATELTITRTLERGKEQKVSLLVRRLGLPEEGPITDLAAVNERIIDELGHMNGEALRNSCLVEQKGLDRLQHLSGAEREETARRLLGLEKLMRLTEQFNVIPEDEQALKECSERLRLAEMQSRIPELSKQLSHIDAALDAIKVSQELDEIAEREADIAEQEQAIEQVKSRRGELKASLGRVQQLKKADATLGDIIAAYDSIAEARREIPELEKQIAELERREREELPALEKRVNELGDLLHSFGTLQRMSNDLLTAVDTIKELEQELRQQDEVLDDLKSLDEQIERARERVEQAQNALRELEERRRAGRPLLEARLQRMKVLAERLSTLRNLEEQYLQRLAGKEQAEKNKARLKDLQKELRDTQQELTLVEKEARQAQQQADALETRWKHLNVCRQLEEWVRLKGMAEGLAQAEEHVRMAYQQQERLNLVAMDARASATRYQMTLITCITLFIACLAIAGFEVFAQHAPLFATIAGLAAILLVAGAGFSLQNYSKVNEEVKETDRQVQEATSKVRMMIAARETAIRMGNNEQSLQQVENEIRANGGSVPSSIEEAQAIIQRANDQGESLAEVQQRMREKLEEVNAARNQVNVTMEALASLRKERARLEELQQQEHWSTIEETLSDDRAAILRLHQEITMLAGQEGLPLPSISDRLQSSSNSFSGFTPLSQEENLTGIPELESLVEGAIRDTEREIAALDGKLDLVTDLADQVKIHQDALNVLLDRKRVIEARNERYKTNNPALQIERAREQQAGLRQALQSLQDSLRQRVRPLGIVFGQAAISSAEAAARKQLGELHMNLGNKIMLQEKLSEYTTRLKELQEALAEHYKQLAKYSNTLGSWIVPPKPFAEALLALRKRCQHELEIANEAGINKELDTLRDKEGAATSKIALCRQEISNAQEQIAALLTQHNRQMVKDYTYHDIVVVWPLLGEYSPADHERLQEERKNLEEELSNLEKQELALSQQLQIDTPLDLDMARKRMEQQERTYQIKKRGNQLVTAVNERLMQKMVPRIEYYMQQILPLLTSGRYHDVHLTAEQEEGTISGGPLHIQVWDSAAGEYVSTSALSAGTADQLSLALRLAFAIATLPRELSAAPGFLLLDEPLSSFDRNRTQALVDVINSKILSQHFEQIVLISHSSAFDPAMFPYHLYLDNGLMVESNLPVVSALPIRNVNEVVEEEATQMRIVAVPAQAMISKN